MIWPISSVARPLYCNYNLADFLFYTTVLLQLRFTWFLLLHHCFIGIMTWLISSIAPLFLLQIWVGWFLLFHHRLIALIIWLISPIAPLFLLRLWFSWFLLLQYCFIEIMVWLISSVAPLFYWNFDLADFSYTTTILLLFGLAAFVYWATVLLTRWFGWFLLLQHYFFSNISRLLSSIPPLFSCD